MKSKKAKKIVVAYIPVLHEGYRRFFKKHSNADALYILGTDITKEFRSLVKDIRALDPELIQKSVGAWKIFGKIEVINKIRFAKLATLGSKIIMPRDNIMQELAEKYLPDKKIVFDDIFLRWDLHRSFDGKPVEADQSVSKDARDVEVIELLKKEATKSSDWWHRVGAAVVKNGEVVLITHNHTVPDEHLNYLEGDPRSNFHKGVNVELSTSFHCEAALIADAAKKGISLEGASMYVTTFPCPPCAKLIAYSGIKNLYYAGGYGVLDGERVLKARGVKIIFVETNS